MAVGKARPDKGEETVVNGYITALPQGTPEQIDRRLAEQGPAPTLEQVMAQGDEAPSGEEIHQVAREKEAERNEEDGEGRPATGEEVVAEATERKEAAGEVEADRTEAAEAEAAEKIDADGDGQPDKQ